MNAEEIYNKAFERYISPSMCEKMVDKGWLFYPFSNSKNVNVLLIQGYIDNKNIVRCCYMASPIRDCHNYYIMHKSIK